MWQWTRIPSTCQTGEIVWFLGIEESRSNRKKHRPESQEGPVEPRVGGLLGLQRKWKRHVGVRLGSARLSSWGQMRPVCFPLWLLPAFLSLSLSPHPPKTGFPGEPELCHIDCLWPLELTAAFFRLVTGSCREQRTGSPWLLWGQHVPHIHPALSSHGGKWLHAMNISERANELNP